MSTSKKNISDTKVQLTLTADAAAIAPYKERALRKLGSDLKIQGFRPGKAPLALVEKQINPNLLQSEVIDATINGLYGEALTTHSLRPVAQPKVTIKAFVPFESLSAEIEIEVIGSVTLPDYKKIQITREKPAVASEEIDAVLKQLASREAEKKDVDRAAKNGDQVWIDFKGVDAKTKEPIKGADGKEYPLVLGSDTFIPGFEKNLVGAKANDEREFTLTFPKDYGVAALQNRKVTFTVHVKKVQEVIEPKLDDTFAAKVGPFKSMAELKEDVKKELLARKEADIDQKFTDELLRTIAQKTKVAIPEVLVLEQLERMENEHRQNLAYRGQTWKEYLDAQNLTEDSFRAKNTPDAKLRAKAGVVLAEIAETEKIEITPEEFNAQLQLFKERYPDPKMRAELDKPENRRDIVSRMLTDKTIAKLKEYASK